MPLEPPEVVDCVHLTPETSDKPYKRFGNAYIKVLRNRRPSTCTCVSTYKRLFSSSSRYVVHFGCCPYNTDFAIFGRQFASDLYPSAPELVRFAAFFALLWQGRRQACLEKLDSLDYSWETFIAETDPGKRALYQRGREKFLLTGKIPCTLECFSKTNEVHHTDDPEDPRPRCLFNPSDELKAVGAYIARLMIKIVKNGFPEFISGMNLNELTSYMEGVLATHGVALDSASFYSYDSSGHDSHQHPELIEIVDHAVTRDLLPHLLPRTWIPQDTWAHVMSVLTRQTWSARTSYGMSFEMTGTVFSGHPTRTTLFNTLRTVCYNLFIASEAGLESHVVFGSGDDVFGHQSDPAFMNTFWDYMSSSRFGTHGIGQLVKKVDIGRLEVHTFLSKRLFSHDGELVMDRLPVKLYNSGICTSSLDQVSLADFKTMQYLQLSDVSDRYAAIRERFRSKVPHTLSKKASEKLMYDWKYKLHMVAKNHPDAVHPHDETEPEWTGVMTNLQRTPVSYVLEPLRGFWPSRLELSIGRRGALRHSKFLFDKMPRKNKNNAKKTRKNNKPRRGKTARRQGGGQSGSRLPENMGDRVQVYNQVSKVNRALVNLNAAEAAYRMSLLNPFSGFRAKVPGVGSALTATTSLRSILSLATNANGFLRVFFSPAAPNVVSYNNDIGLTETAVIATNTAALTYGAVTAQVTRYRVVSAGIQVWSTASALSNQGFFSISRSCFGITNGFDSYRDSPSTVLVKNTQSAAMAYWPADMTQLDWSVPGATPAIAADSVIAICVTGAANAQSFTFRVVVNYEFIPLPANTDLLAASVGPLGDASRVISTTSPPPASIVMSMGRKDEMDLKDLKIYNTPRRRDQTLFWDASIGPSMYRSPNELGAWLRTVNVARRGGPIANPLALPEARLNPIMELLAAAENQQQLLAPEGLEPVHAEREAALIQHGGLAPARDRRQVVDTFDVFIPKTQRRAEGYFDPTKMEDGVDRPVRESSSEAKNRLLYGAFATPPALKVHPDRKVRTVLLETVNTPQRLLDKMRREKQAKLVPKYVFRSLKRYKPSRPSLVRPGVGIVTSARQTGLASHAVFSNSGDVAGISSASDYARVLPAVMSNMFSPFDMPVKLKEKLAMLSKPGMIDALVASRIAEHPKQTSLRADELVRVVIEAHT